MCIVIGLDVHCKSKTTYCIQEKESGEVLKTGEFETDYEGFKEGLGEWLRKYPLTDVGMEAGSKTYYVSTIIAELGGRPRVYSAEEVSAKCRSRKKKSDYRDAVDLCNNLRSGALVREVRLPPRELKELRTMHKVRDLYVRQRTQIVNQTRSMMKEYGIRDTIRSFESKGAWEELLRGEMPEFLREIIKLHYEQYRALTRKIEKMEKKMEEREGVSPEFELLKTIPGIGKIVGSALKAYIFDINRFKSGKHLTSYFGLAPSSYDTGGRERHGRITKQGNGYVRKLLLEAAQKYSKASSPFYPFYARLVGKKGRKKALVALAAKLCRVIYAILKKKTEFDINKLGVERGPVVVQKRYYYVLNRR